MNGSNNSYMHEREMYMRRQALLDEAERDRPGRRLKKWRRKNHPKTLLEGYRRPRLVYVAAGLMLILLAIVRVVFPAMM